MKTRAAVALLAAWAAAAPAAAQENPNEIVRRQLLDQSEHAADAGDHARAVDLAARAGRIRMTTSLRLVLAQEHDALGHTMEALEFAGRCAREAEATPTLNNRVRILEACNRLVATLRPRVGSVTVRVPDPPPGLRVTVAGSELDPAVWGLGYPVLPGRVAIEARAPDGRRFRGEVTVTAGGSAELTVRLAGGGGEPPHTGPGAGPWVVAGAGAAVLGAAVIFYVLRNGAVSDRDASAAATLAQCNADATRCDYADATSADGRARTFTTLTDVALGVGAAAVVGGALWWALARPHGEAPPRAAWRWQLTPTAGGAALGLGGSF